MIAFRARVWWVEEGAGSVGDNREGPPTGCSYFLLMCKNLAARICYIYKDYPGLGNRSIFYPYYTGSSVGTIINPSHIYHTQYYILIVSTGK